MAGDFGKVTQGQKLNTTPWKQAAFINANIDCINDLKSRQGGQPNETPPEGVWNTDLVKVRNLTGSNRARGEVVQLGDMIVNRNDDETLKWRTPWFQGNAIAAPSTERIAVLRMAALGGDDEQAIVIAQVSGICVAKVDIDDTSHRFAFPTAGAYVLSSAPGGTVELLHQAEDTGVQEMFVRILPPNGNAIMQLTSDISAGSWSGSTFTVGTGTAKFATFDGGTLDASDVEVTIYNEGTAIAQNEGSGHAKFIHCVWDKGVLWPITDVCGSL